MSRFRRVPDELLKRMQDGDRRALLDALLICDLNKRHDARTDIGWECPTHQDDRDWACNEECFWSLRCRACGLEREAGKHIYRGHPIFEDGDVEPCDPCIGYLEGAGLGPVGVCCGHGLSGRHVYGFGLHGPAAARAMRAAGGNPPPAAFGLDSISGAS